MFKKAIIIYCVYIIHVNFILLLLILFGIRCKLLILQNAFSPCVFSTTKLCVWCVARLTPFVPLISLMDSTLCTQ